MGSKKRQAGENDGPCLTEALPDDVLDLIIPHLFSVDLVALSATCVKWRAVVKRALKGRRERVKKGKGERVWEWPCLVEEGDELQKWTKGMEKALKPGEGWWVGLPLKARRSSLMTRDDVDECEYLDSNDYSVYDDLDWNECKDMLDAMGNLHTLNLSDTYVTDVSALTNVHTLNLRNTNVTDVSALTHVQKLIHSL